MKDRWAVHDCGPGLEQADFTTVIFHDTHVPRRYFCYHLLVPSQLLNTDQKKNHLQTTGEKVPFVNLTMVIKAKYFFLGRFFTLLLHLLVLETEFSCRMLQKALRMIYTQLLELSICFTLMLELYHRVRRRRQGQHMPICEEKQEQRARKTFFKPLRCKSFCEGPIIAQWKGLRVHFQDQESVLTGCF